MQNINFLIVVFIFLAMKYLVILLLMISFVSASCGHSQVDINSASAKELEKITWIGEATAQKIIDSRPFSDLDELTKVSGIGDTKLNAIKEEGIACIEDEESDNVKDTIDNSFDERVVFQEEVKNTSKEKETIILGTEDAPENSEKLIYASKDAVVVKYAPYALCVILICIIGVLLWQRF